MSKKSYLNLAHGFSWLTTKKVSAFLMLIHGDAKIQSFLKNNNRKLPSMLQWRYD